MSEETPAPARGGPPPLEPFGLVLHHDGRFTHEGQPIGNRRLREHFERNVEYLVDEHKYIVRLQHFRGEVVVEEAGFFVRDVDFERGDVLLSDGASEPLEVASLDVSPIDGALTCRVKRDLDAAGLLARFTHAAQAEFLQAVEVDGEHAVVELAGRRRPLPERLGLD